MSNVAAKQPSPLVQELAFLTSRIDPKSRDIIQLTRKEREAQVKQLNNTLYSLDNTTTKSLLLRTAELFKGIPEGDDSLSGKEHKTHRAVLKHMQQGIHSFERIEGSLLIKREQPATDADKVRAVLFCIAYKYNALKELIKHLEALPTPPLNECKEEPAIDQTPQAKTPSIPSPLIASPEQALAFDIASKLNETQKAINEKFDEILADAESISSLCPTEILNRPRRLGGVVGHILGGLVDNPLTYTNGSRSLINDWIKETLPKLLNEAFKETALPFPINFSPSETFCEDLLKEPFLKDPIENKRAITQEEQTDFAKYLKNYFANIKFYETITKHLKSLDTQIELTEFETRFNTKETFGTQIPSLPILAKEESFIIILRPLNSLFPNNEDLQIIEKPNQEELAEEEPVLVETPPESDGSAESEEKAA